MFQVLSTKHILVNRNELVFGLNETDIFNLKAYWDNNVTNLVFHFGLHFLQVI